ncbi:MAG: purine-nucleoside phosphorylase [Chitinophagaceae bacterium]|nr:MAG: purine-nucleoside phosphorylase [Chitinophagaceae bacterium]
MLSKIKEATEYIKNIIGIEPIAGVVLGSGLGNFGQQIKIEKEIPYADIPHFPVSTVEGHSGKLLFGELSGKKIVAMSGRFHYYEGYTPHDVVFPIRVMKYLGIKTLFLSNAAGGTNPSFKVGDLMLIKDHISFFTPNPLIGKNEKELGTRFPDMTEPYNKELINQAKKIAADANIDVKEGVYISVTGPTFETKAEYKLVHILGADAVGMSTVQETIAAVHMGLPVFAVSVITDLGIREDDNVITHEEVLEAAHAAEPKLTHIFKEMIAAL